MKTLKLRKKEDRRLRRGHPWAFSNEIESLSGIEPGDLVELQDASGALVGTGYANPRSLIAVRLISRPGEEFGPGLIRRRVEDARAYREKVCPGRKSYRAFYSESDFLPGLVVDNYGGNLVVQSLTAGVERMLPEIIDALKAVYSPKCILLRNDSGQRKLEGLAPGKSVEHGRYDGPVDAVIGGLKFKVDMLDGQKTGFFLDQVDNYALLKDISKDAHVLDLFCHTGAWALTAANFGAASCTGVDSSEHALAGAVENTALNGLFDRVEYERADVFAALKTIAAGGKRYDVVVCDPPAFIKSRAKTAEGLKGYRDLNVKAMRVVKPGGWLVSCSCSHHLSREGFVEMLQAAAVGAGRAARVVEIRSQSKDHPALLAAPETDYLKCALLQLV